MTTLSTRLGLKKHTTADDFRIADYTDNWNVLDGAPGTFICTSTTRPTWTASQAGRLILETDTGLEYRWTGSAWSIQNPRGLVTYAERLTAISTTSTTFSNVLATSAVLSRGRRHLVIAQAPRVYSTAGLTGLAILRDGTTLQQWVHQGATGAAAANAPRPLSMVTTSVPADGSTVTYTLQFRVEVGYAGTCYVEAETNRPTALTVVEI